MIGDCDRAVIVGHGQLKLVEDYSGTHAALYCGHLGNLVKYPACVYRGMLISGVSIKSGSSVVVMLV